MILAAIVTLVNVLASSGFAVAGLLRPDLISAGGEARFSIFAMYAAARALPLLAAVILAIVKQSKGALLTLGWLVAAIQFSDALVGLLAGDSGKTLGPFFLGALQSYAMLRLWSTRSNERTDSAPAARHFLRIPRPPH